jgi:hypothetical protein
MTVGKENKPVQTRSQTQDGYQPLAVERRGYQPLDKGYQPTGGSEIPQPPNVGSAAVMPLNSVPVAPAPVAPATIAPATDVPVATGTKTEAQQ